MARNMMEILILQLNWQKDKTKTDYLRILSQSHKQLIEKSRYKSSHITSIKIISTHFKQLYYNVTYKLALVTYELCRYRGAGRAIIINKTHDFHCVLLYFLQLCCIISSSCYIIDFVPFLPCYFVTLHMAGLVLHQDLFCVLFRARLKLPSLLPSYSEALASSSSVSVSTKYFLPRITK